MAKAKKSVCILATGGTIGMQKTAQGYAPARGFLAEAMANIPELNNDDMPHYVIHEYEQPIDSANVSLRDWQKIAAFIEKNYAAHDGFLILHGTDTMAYTASALSFMLENLAKPVILTGAQLPLFETRSDARENLINALLMANDARIQEVCVYFNNKLFRGNRCKKVNALDFAAFASPNFPVLGKVGTDVKIRHELLRAANDAKLQVHQLEDVEISSVRIFPGFSAKTLQHILQAPLQALVIETYGVGTAPENKHFLAAIKQATDRGVIVVNCSQCAHAKVQMQSYAAGVALQNAGVISGMDMTVEATLAKLFYLFSQKNLSREQIKQLICSDLRGELSR